MTDQPKVRRKPQGPRKMRPIFLLIGYKDESGRPVTLDRNRVEVVATRDPLRVAEAVTDASARGEALCITKVDISADA